MSTRAHVVLPEELISEIDRLAGKRKRSQFIEAAVRDKLTRDRLGVALERAAGVVAPEDYPQWDTPEKISEWVRKLREGDEAGFRRKFGKSPE